MATYRGIAFPFRKGPTSFPEGCEDQQAIKQSLVQIVMTVKGERYMRPAMGVNALDYLFEVPDEDTIARLRQELVRAIGLYEKRVVVQSIRTVVQGVEETELVVTIDYYLVATGQPDTAEVVIGV
jgi:phage baseplate assembly protein W